MNDSFIRLGPLILILEFRIGGSSKVLKAAKGDLMCDTKRCGFRLGEQTVGKGWKLIGLKNVHCAISRDNDGEDK